MIESNPTKDDLFYNPPSSIAITWGQFFVGVALYVLSYFLVDDAFGVWTTERITSTNMAKFIIGMLLLSPGLILWQSAIFRLSSHTGYHWIANIIFLFIFCIALFAVGAIYFVKWGIEDWLQWDQNFESSALIKLVQGIYVVLTMWLTGITIFHVLIRAILQRNLYTTEAKINTFNQRKSNAEQQPLIQSGITEMTAKSKVPSDNLNINNSRRESPDYRPLSKSDREFEETSSKFFEYVSIFLFFFVYIPIFLWINCVNVSDWHRMYPSEIITKLASTEALTDSWNIYFQFTCGIYDIVGVYQEETCYARLYYDILYWYLFIFWIAILSYIVHKVPAMRLLLRKRIYLGIDLYYVNFISVTIGEILFWILWLIMMICIGYYFVNIHLFDESIKTTTEIWARYVGIMSIQFLTMMLFCTTRIRIWNDCFMISFEHLIGYHRFFGFLMILSGYIHLILWLIFWSQSNESNYLPFGPVPLSYHDDNFTPIFMYYIMIFFVPIIYIICTFYIIRRSYFELFYYSHLFGGLIMIAAILYHATQSWRYIIPPLSLYGIDRMIRMANSSRICKVESLNISVNGQENDNRIEVTKLSFSIGSYSMKWGEAGFKNMNYKMGQYAFINISNISLFEWHPFTIASGEDESESYLQIQNEGAKISEMNYGAELSENRQFTNLLYALAQKIENNIIGNHDIELHIDGPYGKPFIYDGYQRVILIAGGIGITPCHSIFSTMLSRSRQYGGRDSEGRILPFVDLIWVSKDSKMFSMFTSTWRLYEVHNPEINNKFSVRLFATRQSGNVEVIDDETDEHKYQHNQQQDDDTEFNHVVPHTDATMYTYGRPDWSMLLNIINDNDNNPNKTIVFVCGPKSLTVDIEKYSVKYGARFTEESFIF